MFLNIFLISFNFITFFQFVFHYFARFNIRSHYSLRISFWKQSFLILRCLVKMPFHEYKVINPLVSTHVAEYFVASNSANVEQNFAK